MPALLCLWEPAQGTLVGGISFLSMVLYGIRTGGFRARKRPNYRGFCTKRIYHRATLSPYDITELASATCSESQTSSTPLWSQVRRVWGQDQPSARVFLPVERGSQETTQVWQMWEILHETCDLRKHISQVHDKLKPFYCENCQFRSGTVSNLNIHRMKSHQSPKLSKKNLIEMVENGQHPRYTISDLPMIRRGPNW